MTTAGYGICGHKNTYTCNVKIDNWVEDTVGARLSDYRKPSMGEYSTVTKESFIDPKDMPDKAGPNPSNEPTSAIIERNRTGLRHDILFIHGKEEHYSPNDMYMSINQLTFTGGADQGRPHVLLQQHHHDKKIKTEQMKNHACNIDKKARIDNSYRTTYGLSNKLVKDSKPKDYADAEPLPNFGKSSKFSSKHNIYWMWYINECMGLDQVLYECKEGIEIPKDNLDK